MTVAATPDDRPAIRVAAIGHRVIAPQFEARLAAAVTQALAGIRTGAQAAPRLVLVSEGGYDLEALAEGLAVTLDVVAGTEDEAGPGGDGHGVSGDTRRAETALRAVREAQRPFWGAL